ncbi:MAG: tetratricopeptide repeat protein, partial [Candidatus Anammoxibacter sp.]
YGFMQYFDKDPFNWSSSNHERIFSTFGNPVFYAAFLITTLPLSLALYLGYEKTGDRGQKAGGSWKFATGSLQLVVGCLQLAIGNWQLAVGSWRKAVCSWQLANYKLAKDIVYGICTLIIYTIFWHTKTRACFVGLIVLLPIFIIFLGKERLRANKWKLLIMLTLFVVIGSFYNLNDKSSVFKKFASEIKTDEYKEEEGKTVVVSNTNDRSFIADKLSGSSFNRYYQYKTGLKIYNDYPVLGLGPDTLGMVYQRYLGEVFTRRKDDDGWPRHDKIHNDILDNVVARGAIGLSTYIWLVLAYFWLVWKFLKAKSSRAENSRAASSKLKAQSFIETNQLPIDRRLLVVCFGSAIIGYLVQNEFSFGNTPIVALFWTILALTVVVTRKNGLRVIGSELLVYGCQLPVNIEHRILNRKPRKILLSVLVISLIAFLVVHVISWYKADIYMEMGRKYANRSDFETGIKYYEDAIFRSPYEINYRDLLTGVLFNVAQSTKERVWLENVINIANKSLEMVSNHYLAYFALGNAYFILTQDHGAKKIDLAIENYKKAIEQDPFQHQMYHHISMAYVRKGMIGEATEAMKMATICSPRNVDYVDKLARFYLQQGRLDEAGKLFDETVISSPTASICNAKGFLLAKTGENKSAYIEFAKALKIDNNNMDALNNVISLGLKLSKTDETINYLKHATELAPTNIDYRTNLAGLYAQTGLLKESVTEFDKIIEIDPARQVGCLVTLGKAYLLHSQYDNAVSSFSKAIGISPSNAELYNNLGAAYSQKGLYDKAILEIKKALEMEPDNILFLENILTLYYAQQEIEKSKDTIYHIIRLDEKNEKAVKLLEQIKQKTKDQRPKTED